MVSQLLPNTNILNEYSLYLFTDVTPQVNWNFLRQWYCSISFNCSQVRRKFSFLPFCTELRFPISFWNFILCLSCALLVHGVIYRFRSNSKVGMFVFILRCRCCAIVLSKLWSMKRQAKLLYTFLKPFKWTRNLCIFFKINHCNCIIQLLLNYVSKGFRRRLFLRIFSILLNINWSRECLFERFSNIP